MELQLHRLHGADRCTGVGWHARWAATTIVVVEAVQDDKCGLGYSYTHHAAVLLVRDLLAGVVRGCDPMDVNGAWWSMVHALRNVGRVGLASSALAAVDVALWDLKAHLLELPMVALLGRVRDRIMAYGSGGFTSYDDARLREQLGGWARDGLRAVKMKVGRDPVRDRARMRAARDTIGGDVELFIDANGAFDRKQALGFAHHAAELGVTWFEEPVTSDDLDGLRLLRDRSPAEMAIAAGEYGTDALYFRRMLDAGAVDVLQADATRCGGFTGLLQVGALCTAHGRCRCRRTPRPRCTHIRHAPCRRCDTSSTSTITPASSTCCSMVPSRRSAVTWCPIRHATGSG